MVPVELCAVSGARSRAVVYLSEVRRWEPMGTSVPGPWSVVLGERLRVGAFYRPQSMYVRSLPAPSHIQLIPACPPWPSRSIGGSSPPFTPPRRGLGVGVATAADSLSVPKSTSIGDDISAAPTRIGRGGRDELIGELDRRAGLTGIGDVAGRGELAGSGELDGSGELGGSGDRRLVACVASCRVRVSGLHQCVCSRGTAERTVAGL